MATSNTGSWVRRVGASGGGRTYRKRRPFNFYGVLGLVVVLGFASIAWARYEYEHPAAAASSIPPKVGQTFDAALGITVCGNQLPSLAASSSVLATGYGALKGGVIEVSPLSLSESGTHATLALFVNSYAGLTVSKDKLVVPVVTTTKKTSKKKASTKTKYLRYVAGTTCPKGTPDAGMKEALEIATWNGTSGSAIAHLYTSPSAVHFSTQEMLITIAFGPAGKIPPKPPGTAVGATVAAINANAATTTTTTPVTIPTSSTTTTPTSSTTTTTTH